jgi:hypothetical protein
MYRQRDMQREREMYRCMSTLPPVNNKNLKHVYTICRLPPLKIPVLEALSSQGSGVFDTTYCDGQLRITRGDRGELRVFTKA